MSIVVVGKPKTKHERLVMSFSLRYRGYTSSIESTMRPQSVPNSTSRRRLVDAPGRGCFRYRWLP
jgi:hypothetical protein